jgi:phosphatidylserine decarboxylase
MRFNGGSLAVFRLAPADYHRFHCPVDAVIEGITWIGYPEKVNHDDSEGGSQDLNGNGQAVIAAGGPPGNYYTVNPQAINQNLAVLESNVRSILYLRFPETISPPSDSGTPAAGTTQPHPHAGRSIAIVAIGALLVGSIVWTGGAQKKGTLVRRGEELGYFKYGGSTVVAVWEKDCMKFDDDLVKNAIDSQQPIETLVRVGESLGKLGGHERK